MKIIESDNGIYEIHSNYVIARYHGGIHVELEPEATFIVNMLNDNFSGTYGWISDRINSYSFDPLIIAHVIQNTSDAKCFATVTYKTKIKKTDYLEDVFPDDIQISDFDSLPPAIAWIKASLIKS